MTLLWQDLANTKPSKTEQILHLSGYYIVQVTHHLSHGREAYKLASPFTETTVKNERKEKLASKLPEEMLHSQCTNACIFLHRRNSLRA